MRQQRRPSTLALLLPLLLSSQVFAQGSGGDGIPTGLPGVSEGGKSAAATSDGAAKSAAASSTAPSAAASTDNSAAASTDDSAAASTTDSSAKSTTTSAPDKTVTGLPGLSSAIAKTSGGAYDGITNAPTVTGAPKTFSYPAPSVPPTADAPFMQHSSLPDGTVFIAVGAALGFIFMLFLLWRALVAWSLSRSIKRANNPFSPNSKKGLFSTAMSSHGEGASMLTKPFYNGAGSGVDSSLSLDPLSPAGARAASRHSAQPPPSSLFFSPTAGGHMQSPTNHRNSSYLPAGYYAAGPNAPGASTHTLNTPSTTALVGGQRPYSMADFSSSTANNVGGRDYRYERARSMGPSPPSTPGLGGYDTRPPDLPYSRNPNGRLSTASLGTRSEGRAPSAYLEDLFDAPPVPQPGSEHRRRS